MLVAIMSCQQHRTRQRFLWFGGSVPLTLKSFCFCLQVEAIINPQFVAEILSTKPEIDILALTKELEHEEELTVDQVDREGEFHRQWGRSNG